MSHSLILVGITALLTTYSNSAHASQVVQPQEINNALQSKNFWWLADDSPLKKSYDVFKRCASNGECGGSASFASADASAGPIQIDKNVFLSGSPSEPSEGIAAFHSGASVKIGNNPLLLTGQYVSVGQQNGECAGVGQVCVSKNVCVNGVVAGTKGTIRKDAHTCNSDEVCCSLLGKLASNINGLADFTQGKSSFPEKLGGNFEANAGGVHVNFIGQSGSPSSTAKPVRDISGVNAGGFQFASTPDYSNVNFDSSARFNSDFDGEDYLPPVQTSCPPGTYKAASGRCESVRQQCPPGSRPTPSGGCEVIPTPGPRCGPGQKEGPYGQCLDIPRPTPPPQVCGPQEILSPSGQCIARPTPPPRPQCGPGQQIGPNGQCIYIQTHPPTTTARPTCPPGQRPGPYGGCIQIQTQPPPTTPRPTCPPGQRQGPYGGCVPIQTQPPPTTARPTCPPGQREGPYGGCVPIQTQPPPTTARPTCPPGQRQGPYGGCVPIQTQPPPTTARPTCPPGQRQGPYGSCVPIQTQPPPTTARPTCPPGQRQGPYGGCVPIQTQPPPTTARPTCPPGQRPGPYGGCINIQTQPPPQPTTPGYEYPKPTCAPGQRLGPLGQCERIPPPPTTPRPTCPPGQKQGPYGGCINIQTPPPTTARPTCGPNQYLGPNGQCVYIQTQPPTTTARPTCPPGQRPGPYGGCIQIQTQPPPTTPRPTCPPGQRQGPYGGCVPIQTQPPPTTARPTCPPGQRQGPYGGCVPIQTQPPPTTARPTCPPGQKQGPYGGCVPIQTQPPPTTARPTCPPGQRQGPYGGCVPIQTQPPPTTARPTCPPGQRQGPYGGCVPIQTQPPPTTARPTCPPGQKQGPYGGCINIQTPPPTTARPTCPPGSFPTAGGSCQRPPTTQRPTTGYEYPKPCPPGYIKSPTGQCEPPPPPRPICPSGTFLGASGNCERPQPPPPSPTTPGYLPPNKETPRPGYHYPKPTPSFEDGRTEDDTPDRNPDGSRTNEYVVGPPQPPHTRPPPSRTPPPSRPGYESGSEIDEAVIPVGCAAAMKCVQEIYCSPQGTISSTPVILSKEQELFRVPTTICKDVESGSLGVCCRDTNYQDAWPSANLKNGIDDGQYAEDDSIGQYKDSYNRIQRSSNSTRVRKVLKRRIPKKMSKTLERTKRTTDEECGVRHQNTKPPGERPIDANFAEIPWQAMILRDTNRSLLCGGVIIRKNAVLTAAHCVYGLETSDVLIKGGEWKLGIDEEPLPFQIVKVQAIVMHPDWVPGSLVNDMAVLYLEENLRFTTNVGKICLPQPNQIPTQNCISTGWGKRILQLHARGALMHKINVNIMDNNQCKEMLTQYFPMSVQNYSPNTLCGFSDIDACRVDYGSSLACADNTGRYTLSGIYSWDTGCRQQGQIAGFVAPDVDWIEYVLDKSSNELRKFDRQWRQQHSTLS